MALVAWIAYRKTKGQTQTAEGYFLAGRGLTGTFIAGSLLLTNLSAEQLIGLNGSAYGFNMTAMAWEVTAGFAIIIMALVFLPRYLGGAFSTLPEFLEHRYDAQVRRLSALLFLIGYGLITIPSILYSGALAVLRLFDVPALLQLNFSASLTVTILAIGCVGGMYAVFGGLKAVAVSDTINGIGLLIIGVVVPVLGLALVGDGSIWQGLTIISSEHPEKLNAVGNASDPVPFGTIFTGMILANLFYWGTNQYVIQRTLGAQSLREGQKGVLLAGFFKLLVPFFMMLPGVIAFHLYQGNLSHIDLAYPTLVAEVLPTYLAGFFLAVLLGAVFSSFNSLLNSAATLFCLDIYFPLLQKRRPGTNPLDDRQLVRTAKIVSLIIAVFSFIAAPLLQYAPDGLWQIIRIFTGFYNIPIIALVLMGLFSTRVSPRGAKVAVGFHVIAYGLLQFVFDTGIHFIHLYGILFIAEITIIWAIGRLSAAESSQSTDSSADKAQTGVPPIRQNEAVVDMQPWRYAGPCAILLVAGIIETYVLFSPFGLAGGSPTSFWTTTAVLSVLTGFAWLISLRFWDKKYGQRH